MRRRLTLKSPLFEGRTGRGARVAVVDSGLSRGHPHVGAVAGGVSFLENPADYGDRLGHGTAVAAVIREKAPAADLLAVRILDQDLRTTSETLALAVRWAADHAAQIINLSLGTPNEDHKDLLADAVQYASERGALVVAALEQYGARMYPGALAGALGVLICDECARDEFVVASETSPPHFYASRYPRPIPGVPQERNFSGVSFAVANVSGFLARLVEASGPEWATSVLWQSLGGHADVRSQRDA